MEVKIGFYELKQYVASHFNQNIDLEYDGNKEITVFYVRRILKKDMHIGVKLTVEEVNNDSVLFSLHAGTGLNFIIAGALDFLQNYFAELAAGITHTGNRIAINLSKIKQTEKLVKKVALQDIGFTPNDIILTVGLL